LGLSRKLLLVLAAITALAGPVAIGVVNATASRAQSGPAIRPTFEVAWVKPYKDDGVGPRNSHTSYGPQGVDLGARPLAFIIGEAYNFPVGRVSTPGLLRKGPIWESLTQGYDIVAKADHAVPKEQLRLMLQSLLAYRFKLTLHREAKTGPVYKLVIAKGGPKLEESQEAGGGFIFSGSPDGYVFRNAEMMRLSGFLSGQVDRTVVDQTGLTGLYNFILKMPEELRQNPPVKSDGRSLDSPPSGIFADSLKQLGLQLIAGTAGVEYLVVDHVERPSDN
jgi:bla regulator protein BlaR1